MNAIRLAKLWWCLAVCTVLAIPVVAFAQPGAAMGLPTTDQDAFDLGKKLWELFVTKQYGAAFGPGLTILIWLLRKYDLKIPKIGPSIDRFFNKPFIAFLTPIALSSAAGLANALYMHAATSGMIAGR